MSEKDEGKMVARLRAEVERRMTEREQYKTYLAELNAWKRRHRTISELKKATGAS